MNLIKLCLILISGVLFYWVFHKIDYLTYNKYVVECFTNNSSTHNVDMPLTTEYSCQNFCGPTARCAITGQQCFADTDCPGCQPPESSRSTDKTDYVPGDNASGKLTVGVTPQYSPLTSGYGTNKKIITKDMNGKPAQPNFGVNTWREKFDESLGLFNQRYQLKNSEFMPKYPPMYSITGEFLGDGPLPSNY